MSDFLDFLNTADLDTLIKTPGVSRVLAGNLIAARPFDAVEDCLNVHGMGKNLLAKMQASFEAGEKTPPTRAMIQLDESPKPMEKRESAPDAPNGQDSFLNRLGKAFLVFIRALFRLIALAILMLGIGAAFYYGLPYFNQKVVIPIERNSADIKDAQAEIRALQARLDETANRVDRLETSTTELKQSIAAHSASLTKLDEIQNALEAKIQTSQDETLAQLKREITFTRALDILGRARLYLAQSNFGLARNDVSAARKLLAELNDPAHAEAVKRLDMALNNLPAFPVVAAGDLEIAWQMLVGGETPATLTPEPTVTPAMEPTPTASP
ncbi:MAG: helix-hairpin-helix domain-containing protein [Chloroflexi bacterium]|nr:helix-hairpin-helix domain-containing protein [Chloroflexota bacterium]MCA2001878.1 helix-hairpin-helix domain-containing protein [Chloroflexota bacterium]